MEGYILKHTLVHSDKSGGFTINAEFINNSEKDVEIDMLWFMTENKDIPVAAGGGDNACTAVGSGTIKTVEHLLQ